MKFLRFVCVYLITPLNWAYAMETENLLLTLEADHSHILRKAPSPIKALDWGVVKDTISKLVETRNKIGGGAGLAAPQIGLSLPIFIYTPDRTDENLRAVINPSIEPVGIERLVSEEACFSVPLHVVSLPRWVEIHVKYQNIKGSWIEERLAGFAAKVFQHEYAHLQGQLIIDHTEAKIEAFSSQTDFEDRMNAVKKIDSKIY